MVACKVLSGPALTQARWEQAHSNRGEENLLGHSSVFFGGEVPRVDQLMSEGKLEQVGHEWLDFGSEAIYKATLDGPDHLFFMSEMEGGVAWYDAGVDPSDPEACAG
jgi:hypothetical protein